MWRQRSVEQRVANVSHVLARGAVRKPNLPDSVWSSATSRGNKCVKEICKQDKTEKRSSATTETRSDHKLTSAFVMMASDEFCTAEEGCQVQNWYIQSQNQQSACRRKARHTPIHALKHTHTHRYWTCSKVLRQRCKYKTSSSTSATERNRSWFREEHLSAISRYVSPDPQLRYVTSCGSSCLWPGPARQDPDVFSGDIERLSQVKKTVSVRMVWRRSGTLQRPFCFVRRWKWTY